MSFILDALRKSEIERQRQSGPSMAEFPIAREDRRQPVALIAIGVLLAVNVGVLLFFLLRDKAAPAAAATQVAVAAPAPVPNAPPPQATATAPASTATPLPASPAALSPLEAEVAGGDDYSESAPPIYGTPTQPPGAPDPTLIPEAQPSNPGVIYGESPKTEDASAVTAATGLPELSVDLHIYSANPAKRAIFINGRRYVQGDHIAEGPVVEQITPEGAMLSYRGRRFLLPRL